MARRRDPERLTAYLCRFCGEGIRWGTIVRVLRYDPGQPTYLQVETACHLGCLERVVRPEVALTFPEATRGGGPAPAEAPDACALCGEATDPAERVVLRAQRPTGTVKVPAFDEQVLAAHAACLADVSLTKLS